MSDQQRHFDLGLILNSAVTDVIEPTTLGSLSVHHAGLWECDLNSNRLVWSGGVYDLFGVQRGHNVTREQALSCYSDESKQILEHFRSNAIQMGHGFTVDVEIRPSGLDEQRWVRIIAAPVIEAGQIRKLHGLKLSI